MSTTMALLTLPNLLSISRVLLAALMFLAVTTGTWLAAAIIIWTAVATDVADGFIARRSQTSTPLGGLLDHGSDAIFVTVSIAALTFHGWAPAALVILIPAAFAQYTLDSKALSGRSLRTSQLGRYNGIAYFFYAGFPAMQIVTGIELIPFDLFIWVGWGLVISTVISMVDRLVSLLSGRVQKQRTPDP